MRLLESGEDLTCKQEAARNLCPILISPWTIDLDVRNEGRGMARESRRGENDRGASSETNAEVGTPQDNVESINAGRNEDKARKRAGGREV